MSRMLDRDSANDNLTDWFAADIIIYLLFLSLAARGCVSFLHANIRGSLNRLINYSGAFYFYDWRILTFLQIFTRELFSLFLLSKDKINIYLYNGSRGSH